LVLSHPFHCPTRVVQGQEFASAVSAILDGRTYLLVTSGGWRARGAVDRLGNCCGAPVATIVGIETNPRLGLVMSLASGVSNAEAVVALGGGSVLDAAKAIAALSSAGAAGFVEHLTKGVPLGAATRFPPIIAVPTTSGTGSEVTRWGTIWGDDGAKHSVTDERLYPSHAVLDPQLCVSMPASLTLSTGLDALSHAMEAIWNKRHGSITDALASHAIGLLRASLFKALDSPADLVARDAMQTAAVLAGFAMGTTQTALAHSISYPFTSTFDVPHGLACSFTLAECARYNGAGNPGRLQPIAAGFGCSTRELPGAILEWFLELGVPSALANYVGPDSVGQLGGELINPARAANNIRDADDAAARRIVEAAFESLTPRDG
jgi:phosphonate metabolism-associated iron-containing alcohol dehydrogenase